jgi:hypothetical protein
VVAQRSSSRSCPRWLTGCRASRARAQRSARSR